MRMLLRSMIRWSCKRTLSAWMRLRFERKFFHVHWLSLISVGSIIVNVRRNPGEGE